MSSRVNLGLLVEHINSLPETFLDGGETHHSLHPNLKFKILHAPTPSTTALPPLNEHFPESFFSFDVSTKELKQMAAQSSLQGNVHAAFTKHISLYAALLKCKTVELPRDVLYVLLPFLHGKKLTPPMLKDIVAEVGKPMGTSAAAITTNIASREITERSKKRAKLEHKPLGTGFSSRCSVQ